MKRARQDPCGAYSVSDSLLTVVTVYATNTAIELDARGLPFVSPSGAQTLRRCQRRYGWQKLDGIREPQGSGARLGSAHHDALERYLRGTLRGADDLQRENYPDLTPEQWTTLRRIVRAVLASGAYPEPRPGVVIAIEQDLGLACENASWRGRADAILSVPPGPLWEHDVVDVHDHKTTRDLEFALDDSTLPTDPQAVFYASSTHERCATAGIPLALVGLQWTYVQTHGEAAVHVARGAMTPSEAHERMQALDAEVGAVVRELARTRPRVLDLAPSWDQCDAFGGCPHRERCGERPIMAALSAALDHAPGAGAKGDLMSQQQYTFAEKFAAPAQPQGPAPTQAPPAQMGPPPSLQAVFAQGQQPPSGQPAPTGQVGLVMPAQGPQPGPYTGVNRPDGPANGYPELQAAARPSEVPAASSPQQAQSVLSPQYQQAQPAPSASQQYQHQQPAPVQAAPSPAPQSWSAPQAQPQALAPVQAPQVAVGFVLLVGAALVGALPFRRVVPLEALLARAAAVLRERQGVLDYRTVEYGNGPGLLAIALQGALLEAQVGQGDALLVSHLGPEWQAVGAALRAQAAGVIQGTVG